MNHYLHAKADDAAEAIENYISMHNLNPHDRIPSERAMAEELGINRTTCREALKRLENEHILYSIVGSGTYVAPPKLRTSIGMGFSLDAYCEANGFKRSNKLIYCYQTLATDYISKILGLSPYSPIYIIKRLRFINQKPAMIETTHLSEAMFPELLRKFKENETQSLYALMKNVYNIIPTHHSYKVSMNICDIDNAVLLGIETNSPLLNFSIISKDSNNNVIEYCQSLRRIDRCCINASFKNY